MSLKLSSLLKDLRASERVNVELGLCMMNATDGVVFPVDLLALAALNRSASLMTGFASLIEARNLIAAVPLLRLQIDNGLRVHGVYIVAKLHDFADAVLNGQQVRKMKDSKGKLMTDRHLVECVAKDFPWITRVYEKTSGYVHLSNAHIASVFSETQQEKLDKGTFEIAIGPGHTIDKPALYEEAVEAFIAATKALFHYSVGWIKTKESKSNG